MFINQGTIIGCGLIGNNVSVRTGIVSAIFERTMHLTTEDCVVTLASGKIPNHPFTISTKTLPENINIGDTFSITQKMLSIKRKRETERCYSLDLRFTPVYTPCFKTEYIVSQESIVNELEASRAEARLTEGIEGFFPILIGNTEVDQISQEVIPSINKISLSIRNSDWPEFVRRSGDIVGVGIGLTPSGDDFLSGVFAALYFYNKSFAKGFTLEQLKSLAKSIGYKTSPFSATLIKAAARGWVLEVISSWLVSLFQGESIQIKELTKKILKIGHSSGADILFGLITALESILKK